MQGLSNDTDVLSHQTFQFLHLLTTSRQLRLLNYEPILTKSLNCFANEAYVDIHILLGSTTSNTIYETENFV